MTTPIKIGISACLIGQKVRYDNTHKRDAFIIDSLGRYAELVPICPETECGFGVPRETMRLVQDNTVVRLMTTETNRDQSQQLMSWCRDRIAN